jgi:hypothetical protein
MLTKWESAFALAEKHISIVANDVLNLFKKIAQAKPTQDDYDRLHSYASSGHLRKEYRKRKFPTFIEPVLKQVNELNRFTYSYLPLTKVCMKYISQSNWIVRKLFAEVESHSKRIATRTHYQEYSTIFDGSFSSRLVGKLKLELFVDDANFAPSNGLGSKGQKFINAYLSCADIPFEKRIHSNEMETVIIANRTKLNKSGSDNNQLKHLFEDFKQELRHLMIKGLQVEVNGKCETIQVTLSTIIGDNLGVYEIMGNKRCFNNDAYVCRYCGAKGKRKRNNSGDVLEIQSLCQSFPLITEQGTRTLEELGILREFVFDGLPGISRWNCAPPDLTHDLAEGVVLNVLELILTSIARNDLTGTVKYNTAVIIKQFDQHKFYEGKPALKWTGAEGFKLDGKAIQVSKFKTNSSVSILIALFSF